MFSSENKTRNLAIKCYTSRGGEKKTYKYEAINLKSSEHNSSLTIETFIDEYTTQGITLHKESQSHQKVDEERGGKVIETV